MIQGILTKLSTAFIPDELASSPHYVDSTFAPKISGKVSYHLNLGANKIYLNDLIGVRQRWWFTGLRSCIHCGQSVAKTFQQGYCFPCTKSLAINDVCMVKPEQCHFHLGSCREPAWGLEHCYKLHTVYLAKSSNLKVGITRQVPVLRWIDQGASQGLALCQTESRFEAGLVEVSLKKHFADKTNWRGMLKADEEPLDLVAVANQARSLLPHDVQWKYIEPILTHINYPVSRYAETFTSHEFDKDATFEGVLLGIKGQYLIFADKVINIPKFAGYTFRFELEDITP